MSADPWHVDRLDLAGYLERLGPRTATPSRAALDELNEAHVRTFNFDNIDVSLEQHPGVSTAVLNEKFVGQGYHRRRECGPGACLDLTRGEPGSPPTD